MPAGERLPTVVPLEETWVGLADVGGKGASLSRLVEAGLPVPGGFHVTTRAYRSFVEANGLQDKIVAAAEAVGGGDPAAIDKTARAIRRMFARGTVDPETAAAVAKAYADLGGGDLPVAVRSSATAEDLPGMSFAGQQDTYLNIRGEAAVLDAVKRCWASLWTARAMDYRARNHIPPSEVSLAVVVQELVEADAAGVLFTVDPVTGASNRIVINGAWGLGEAVVGGQVTPDTFLVDRERGVVADAHVSDKTVMTVLTSEGTAEVPVDGARREAPCLTHEQAADLARLAVRIEEVYGTPMDIEWAVQGGRAFILQARPITGLDSAAEDSAAEEWNDSLLGDFVWTSANLGEAVPDVMTPATWSLIQIFMKETMGISDIGPLRMSGNIGGRFYMNLSLTQTVAGAFGMGGKVKEANEWAFGRIPEGIDIPVAPLSRWRIIKELLPTVVRNQRRAKAHRRRIDEFLRNSPARCSAVRAHIAAADSRAALGHLWRSEVEPYFLDACHMMEAARVDAAALVSAHKKVKELVGEADANGLTSGGSGDGTLASLDLVIGLHRLARGDIDRDAFARTYGHRGPHEFEVSLPRPAEDPAWMDSQLARLSSADVNVDHLLARQQRERDAAWKRVEQQDPSKAKKVKAAVATWAKAAKGREATRSEVIRAFWALRAFLVLAGELTGLGEDVFFLAIDEVLAALGGDDAAVGKVAVGKVAARRAAHARYSQLPPYPTVIRGAFDPFRWAADPDRRNDVFDARGSRAPVDTAVTGFPGARGVVEGVARVVGTVEEGDQLEPGEILVTTSTNVGWTPLFPRAAAVVTDVGAPLSHAAIVARELGIPAVVGCGNATMRIATGDRIRVDGSAGTVEVVAR